MSMDTVSKRSFFVLDPIAETTSEPSSGLSLDSEGPGKSGRVRAKESDDPLVLPRWKWYLPIKYLCDASLAIFLLVLTSPIILLGVLLIKVTSRGPAFYRQVRVGRDGQVFMLFKLRTMNNDAEAISGPIWSTPNDSRITLIGHFLRQTHIDEFPQLWNVVRGEMSLVGPRPERPEFVAKLDWEIPHYRERLRIKPGITGLAQLRLPADTSIESVRCKVVHDIFYVHHLNPILDLTLLVLTAARLTSELFGFCVNSFILPSGEKIQRGFRRAVAMAEIQTPIESAPDSTISATADTVPEMMEPSAS
jgi:lipopolysaccharide/colanic/teichoic acid biosynthesis glycosyltransferase